MQDGRLSLLAAPWSCRPRRSPANLSDLAVLVDKTWLRASAASAAMTSMNLARQYAEERLLEEDEAVIDDVRRRHCTYFSQLLRANTGAINIRKTVMSEILSDYEHSCCWSGWWSTAIRPLRATWSLVVGLPAICWVLSFHAATFWHVIPTAGA